MTNNDIFKKLRVALSFRDTDILECLKNVDFEMKKECQKGTMLLVGTGAFLIKKNTFNE